MSSDNTPTTSPEIYDLVEAEDSALRKAAPPRSQGRIVASRFFHHTGAMVSLVVLAIIVLLAVSSIGIGPIPGWWDKDHVATYPVVNGGAPTISLIPTWLGGEGIHLGEHPMGQNTTGKDYFAMVMLGAQRSLTLGLVVGIISTVLGAALGAIAGYFRGWVDSIIMRITDVFMVVPLLLLAAVLGRMAVNVADGVWMLALMIGIVSWTSLARLVRGEVLSLREREFIGAAQSMGASPARIIFRHLMPNTVGVIVVNATFAIANAILLESSLSYLGFGVQPPETSLGLLISQYQGAFTNRPWLFWFPGVVILIIALSINFIGDGLRDAFDPRQTRKFRLTWRERFSRTKEAAAA